MQSNSDHNDELCSSAVPEIGRIHYRILKLYTGYRPILTSVDAAKMLHASIFETCSAMEYLLTSGCLSYFDGFILWDQMRIAEDTQLTLRELGNVTREKYKRNRIHFFWSEFRAWITLVIALAGLFLSLVNAAYIELC